MFAIKSIEIKNVLCLCLVLIFVLASYSAGKSAPFQNPTTFRCISGWHGCRKSLHPEFHLSILVNGGYLPIVGPAETCCLRWIKQRGTGVMES
jgi:hypothetical protein